MDAFRVIDGGRRKPTVPAEDEFTRLYLESYGLVYNYVRHRMSGNETEDVVSEAFLLAARSFHSFDPTRAKFSTWVISIAHNCMVSYYRKARATATLDEVPEHLYSVNDEQDAVGDRELVDQLLGTLDAHERELVLLKYREGMRNVDIAEKLQMNPSTVSTTLARALSKMRSVAERNT